jgi:peptide/nickel transport system permease protein
MSLSYLLRRLFFLALVLWAAITLNFFVPRLAPDRNPVREKLMQMLARGGAASEGLEEMVASYEAKFGLDQPLWKQYLSYLWDLAHLDLGVSIASYPVTSAELIRAALPWTIGLVGLSTLIAFTAGSLLGALVAWPRAPRFLRYLMPGALAFAGMPYYIVGLILLYFFAFRWQAFPGWGGYDLMAVPGLNLSFILDVLYHAALPALSIVLSVGAFWALGMRGMMVTVQGEDYMVQGEAKGLKPRRLFLDYGIRNAILPQFTYLALSLGHVVSSSVLVEVVFGYPGIGSLLLQSIRGYDYFVIYALSITITACVAIATLLMDLTYPLLDARITYGRT